PPVNLQDSLIIDYGFQDTTINAYKPWFTDYTWSIGSNDSAIVINTSGWVSVTVTDELGFTSEDSVYVSYPNPDIISDTTICAGDTITWNTSFTHDYDFLWNDSSTDSLLHINSSGSYHCIISDSSGNLFYTDTVNVAIDDFPNELYLGPDTSLCSGSLFSPLELPAGIVSYLWNTGVSTENIVVDTAGDYILTVSNSIGCNATDTIAINISGIAPNVDFDFDTVCLGDSTHFIDNSSTSDGSIIDSWQWVFNSTDTLTLQSPGYLFSEAGFNDVELTVTTSNGCINSVSKDVFVKPAPIADFSLLYGLSTCPGSPVITLNNSIDTTAYMTNFWQTSGDDTSTDESPTFNFENTGVEQIQLIVTNAYGCKDSLEIDINVANNLPLTEPVDLISPSDNYLFNEASISFIWNEVDDAAYYELIVSNSENFDELVLDTILLNNSFNNWNIPDTSTYFWTVTSYNPCGTTSDTMEIYRFNYTLLNENCVFWITPQNNDVSNDTVTSLYDRISETYSISREGNTKLITDSLALPLLSFSNGESFSFGDILDLNHKSLSIIVLSKAFSGGGYFLSKGFTTLNTYVLGLTTNDKITYYYRDNSIYNIQSENYFLNHYSIITAITNRNNNTNYLRVGADTIGNVSDIEGSYYNFDSSDEFKIGKAGNYFLDGNIAEIIIYDTVLNETETELVHQYLRHKYAPPVNLGYDIRTPFFCDTTITAANKPWFTDYHWSTGSTDSVITVSESGTYAVTVTDIFGFTSTDDIRVVYPEVYQPDAVSEICYGDTLQWAVDLPESDYNFAWLNSDSTGNSAMYWENTEAAVEITDSLGCTYRSDTISVELDMYEFTAGFGTQDTALCIGNRLTFLNGAGEAVSWLWQDGSTDDAFLIEGPGTYHATVTNDLGCVAVDTVDVSILGTVPEPDFGITGHCAGATISLTDSSTSPDGTITTWEWIYNDAVFDTGEQASISFDSAGNYDITLQIYTDVGCHNKFTQTVGVHPLPVPDFAPLTGCEDNAIFFDNLSTIESDTIAYTRWQFFDGDEYHTSGAAGAIHTYDSVGTYNVTMEAVSVWDCADQITQEVEIKPSPEADFAHSAACSGVPVFFSSQSSSSEPLNPVINVSWDFGDGTSSTSNSPEHAYDIAGLYDMELVVFALNGCTDTMHYTINVHNSPEAIATNLNACAATPFMLTDSSVAGGDSIILWSWLVDTVEMSGQQPEIVMQYPGTYALQLRVATEHGCIDEIDTLLYVWETPAANFSMPADWGEVPLTMALENTSGGATAYHWNFGDSTYSEAENPVHTWMETDTYQIQLVAVNDKSCTDTATRELRVVVPMVDLVVIDIRSEMDGNYLVVEADIGNAGSVPVDNPALELNTATGSRHREVLDHSLDAGDVETYTFTTQPYIPDGRMPEYVCVFIDPGVTDAVPKNNEYCVLHEAGFQIYDLYPNPVSGQLNIAMLMPADGEIQADIFDMTGRLMFNKTISLTSGYHILTLDCTEFSSGRYTLRMQYVGSEEIRSFVVE
ncbi:MAG: PKD domain-containing protein, partial [Bacteroidales bacterium]